MTKVSMSSVKNPEGREHVGDEYVTYKRHRERRADYPPFLPVQRKRKRHIRKQREGQIMRQRG
jgi:hypothetical protein